MGKLTLKQQMFVEEFLVDFNATQAAIRAGYSVKRADMIGWENLRKPEILAALDAAKLARQERVHLSQDEVILALRRIMDANLIDYAQWTEDSVSLVASDGLAREQAYCIQEISADKDGRVKIKLHDKVRAALALLEHTAPKPDADAGKLKVEITVIDSEKKRLECRRMEDGSAA